MADQPTELSDSAERYLSTIQYSLNQHTEYDWDEETTLDAILALSEIYGLGMLDHLTDDEIERLSNGDTSAAIHSRSRRGIEKSDSTDMADMKDSTVMKPMWRGVVPRWFDGGESGGLIDQFRK